MTIIFSWVLVFCYETKQKNNDDPVLVFGFYFKTKFKFEKLVC
jgi:hypothetical protein